MAISTTSHRHMFFGSDREFLLVWQSHQPEFELDMLDCEASESSDWHCIQEVLYASSETFLQRTATYI